MATAEDLGMWGQKTRMGETGTPVRCHVELVFAWRSQDEEAELSWGWRLGVVAQFCAQRARPSSLGAWELGAVRGWGRPGFVGDFALVGVVSLRVLRPVLAPVPVPAPALCSTCACD